LTIVSPQGIENIFVKYNEEIITQLSVALLVPNYVGSTISNFTRNDFSLPLTTNIIGSEFSFINTENTTMIIIVNASDQIIGITNNVGTAIQSNIKGSKITLKAISNNKWQVVNITGKWTPFDFIAPVDSIATDVPTLVNDFNILLNKLKDIGVL
jgi:hypothetical protein